MSNATSWFPIATSHDVPRRHVFHGQLLGRELAVWRADDDFVNVWENRCLHRGVRLSIGINDGAELTCRYHGWRYANRSAGCTYIPAHPADAPAQTICNTTFAAVERYGLVWSGEDPEGPLPIVERLETGAPFVLRNLPVNASVDVVLNSLSELLFQPSGELDGTGATVLAEVLGDHAVALTSTTEAATSSVVFFVQPVDSNRSVIRGVLAQTPPESEQVAVWKHHAEAVGRAVDRAETAFASLPARDPLVATIEQVPIALSVFPEAPSTREATLRVEVTRKWTTAEGIAAFELVSISDPLPTFQAGAHIDVHLPNGLVRQYSLTNGPGETAIYRIGVKREPDSTGGSIALHDSVREGDVLAISAPRNNFPLRRDSLRTVLIAGGIGITPMMAMAQALKVMDLQFELHYFAQAEGHVAFPEILDGLGDSVTHHFGLSAGETGTTLRELLASPGKANQLYVCGPGPMLDVTRTIAGDLGWAEESVHFEYFKNPNEIDVSSEFEIALARSATTLSVPSGESILEVLRANGVSMPSSCEQGACGTCVVPVLDGDIDHQDVYLNDGERIAGDQIMTCVSRASSDRLVLDI